MEVARQKPDPEIRELQLCINDLIGILALPVTWSGREADEVIRILLRSLVRMLGLDFMYARLNGADTNDHTDIVEVGTPLMSSQCPQDIYQLVKPWLNHDLAKWPGMLKGSKSNEVFAVVPIPLGLRSDFGIAVAGSQRPQFPKQTEKLLLDVATNHALIALNEAKLRKTQQIVTDELDRRVEQRTYELAVLNEQLKKEVAERKRVEEVLGETERESRLIVESIPGLVALLSSTGSVDVVNHQVSEYFGQTLEELKNWGTNGTVHPDDLGHVRDIFTRSISDGTPYEIVQRLRRGDGDYRWIENRGFPLRRTNGEIARWCVLLTDIDERKRAEDALRESGQLFKTIFDEAGTGITLVDLVAGEPIRNNRALQRMLECTEEELGRFETYDKLTFEGDRERDAIAFRELCEGTRDSLNIEKHFVLKDGKSIWANVIFTLIRDDQGHPRYITTIHEDITERKLALERLQANQDLLDLAQKSAGATAFDWYTQQETNYWSPEQEALFGLDPGTFDGRYQTFKKMLYAPDWPVVLDAIHHAHRTGEVSAEYRVVWPDGSLHWLSTNGRMFFDDVGEPLRMVGFTSDVTRRKIAEEALRRSEAFLAEGQYLARMGNFSWNVSSEEITWSDQMYRLFEFEPGTPVSIERLASRFHPDDLSSLADMVKQAQLGVDDFEYEHRLVMPDGSSKHLHLIAHRSRDDQNGPEYIGAVQDVTQRRLDEEALSKARSELSRTARAMSLGVLTASIAHEVNQPLSGIITNASTCLRMLDADPPNIAGARETARRTIRDGNRASDVISHLRALFSRKDFTPELLDLNDLVLEVLALSRSELQRSKIVLLTELAKDVPLFEGDRVQIQQVILNLLLNAADAMSSVEDRAKQLTIVTKAEANDRVRLSVRDVGIGISSTEAENLFNAFYTTKKNGMGIGLSVSRSIIESHKGRIWAIPNEGHGAIFSFSIPVQIKSAVALAGARAATENMNRKRELYEYESPPNFGS